MNDPSIIFGPWAWLHTGLSCLLALGLLLAATNASRLEGQRDGIWVWGIALLLLVGRWPILGFPFALNPDESQFIAGAHTLWLHPLFWKSVNGMTSGPLNYYVLWIPGIIFGYSGYWGARLTAVALLVMGLGSIHHCAARQFGPRVARLGGLPTLCFLAFTAHPDFTHFSSELLSMALLAWAISTMAGFLAKPDRPASRYFWLGVALGCIPLAKLQVAPLAFVLGLVWLGWMVKHPRAYPGRFYIFLLAGAAAPAVFTALVLLQQGLAGYAFRSYVLQNIEYINTGGLSWWRTAFQLLGRLDPPSPLFFAWAGTGLIGTFLMILGGKISRKHRWVVGGSLALVILAGVCVITPGRPFPHYLMLMPVPWTVFTMALAHSNLDPRSPSSRHAGLITNAVLIGTVLILVVTRGLMPYPPRIFVTPYHSDFSGNVTKLIRQHSRAGDSIGVWGWRADYFVLADRPQAARDAVTESSILPGPYRAISQQYYLDDLKRSRPHLFVDGVGPGAFNFDQRSQDSPAAAFPELAAWISKEYVLIGDLDGSRIYESRSPRQNRPALAAGDNVTKPSPSSVSRPPLREIYRSSAGR